MLTSDSIKEKTKVSKILNIIIILITLIICLFVISQYKNVTEKTIDTRPVEFYRPVNPEKDLILGNPDAELYIIEYGDLECPYCREFHGTGLSIIKSYWGLSGRIAWVWRHGFHINTTSIEKALTVECIKKFGGPQSNFKAWEFIHESLIGGVYEEVYPLERYQDIYKKLNIPGERIEQCRKNGESAKEIENAFIDITALSIEQTPHIQLVTNNGEVLYNDTGALNVSNLEEFISDYFNAKK